MRRKNRNASIGLLFDAHAPAMDHGDDISTDRTHSMGGLFGLVRPDPELPSPQELVDAELRRQALVSALLSFRHRKRRGRPIANWRKANREDTLTVWNDYPEMGPLEFAKILQPLDIWDGLNLSVETIENWLGELRKGKPGFGRRRV